MDLPPRSRDRLDTPPAPGLPGLLMSIGAMVATAALLGGWNAFVGDSLVALIVAVAAVTTFAAVPVGALLFGRWGALAYLLGGTLLLPLVLRAIDDDATARLMAAGDPALNLGMAMALMALLVGGFRFLGDLPGVATRAE